MTLAVVDRLVHHAAIFEMNVESYRRHAALNANADPVGRQSARQSPLMPECRAATITPRQSWCRRDAGILILIVAVFPSRSPRYSSVATFSEYPPDNDPYGEHDFGFELVGRKFFFKLGYYNADMGLGSGDPADPSKNTRMLTIMLAEEF